MVRDNPQDGFALYSDGTQHRVPDACYKSLVASGIESRFASWDRDVDSRPRTARVACGELRALLTSQTPAPTAVPTVDPVPLPIPVTPDPVPTVDPIPVPIPVVELVNVVRLNPQDGFAFYSNGTQHWVPDECYQSLVASGIESRFVNYERDVNSRPQTARLTCGELADLLGTPIAPPPTPAPTTPPVPTPEPPQPPPTPAPTPDPVGVMTVVAPGRVTSGPLSGSTLASAMVQASPGSTFQLAPGNYTPIRVDNVNGTAANPIVLTASDASRPPVFRDNRYDNRAGILLRFSNHVQIRNISVRQSLWGIFVERSFDVVIDSVDVADIGQEAIHIRDRSERVTISNSRIGDTGNRPGHDQFGEGIYLGTGSTIDDPVRNVVITGNEIYDTSAEGVDVKWPVRDVLIEDNLIRNIRTGTSGAVVIHVAPMSFADSGIRIIGNTIRDITDRTPYNDGVAIVAGSSVDIIGNTIANIQDFGIRVEDNHSQGCLLYTSPSPRDATLSRMPSSA